MVISNGITQWSSDKLATCEAVVFDDGIALLNLK